MVSSIRSLLTKLQRAFPQAGYLPRLMSIVWAATGKWSVVWVFLILISGLMPVVTILLTKSLVNDIVKATQTRGSWEAVHSLIIVAVLLATATVLIEILQGLLEWIRTAQAELIEDTVSQLIQNKSFEVDFQFYESPECYDRLYRARDNVNVRIVNVLAHMGSGCQNIITLLALTGIVAAYNGFLLVAMLLSILPAFYVVAHYNWVIHDWWMSTTVQRRWIQYYDHKFSNPAAAAEIRLFGLGSYFQSAYSKLRRVLRESHLALVKRQNVARVATALFGVTASGTAIGWMGWRTLLGKATFGDMALFYQAFIGAQGFMRTVTLSLGYVYSNSLFLKDLFEFLDLQPHITDPAKPVPRPSTVRHGIQFHNVTFRYPGSERVALQKLDLFIPAGKIIAIVGPNGAGKSTLIKLLSRFYDPAEGYITVDDIPLRDMAIEDIRSLLSILFQLPVSYDASAAENIAIGDLAAQPSIADIQIAAESAGAHEVISRLPDGYQTQLGKSFANGTDLSSGEWQRVAMARAFLRQAPIILLDEPTSFMDSWAELDWFERLRKLARGRTAMVITHRFTIAMRADLIHVMEAGQLVECGTHESLLRNDGLYAQSWRDQVSARSELAVSV